MKYFEWNEEKNEKLKSERNISFEIIVSQIELRHLIDIVELPNKGKCADQNICVVECEKYAYLAPIVDGSDKLFLKTIIPSRKATKKYLEGE